MPDRKALCLVSGQLGEIGPTDRLILPGDPTVPLHATPKQYVDTSISQFPLEVGEETIPRELLNSTSGLSSQQLRLSYFLARKSEITTQVKMFSSTAAAAATPTLVRMGLFTIAANGDGTLVASTVNDTTIFAATNTGYTRSWSDSYAKVAGQFYAFGLLIVSAVTMPTLAGIAILAAVAGENALAPRSQGLITGQANLPATFTAASVANTDRRYYGAILP